VYCEEIFCTGPTRAAKAGKKSLAPAQGAQRTNQGRPPFIYIFLGSPFASFSIVRRGPLSSLSDYLIQTLLYSYPKHSPIYQLTLKQSHILIYSGLSWGMVRFCNSGSRGNRNRLYKKKATGGRVRLFTKDHPGKESDFLTKTTRQ
jgi:hypothetical protein